MKIAGSVSFFALVLSLAPLNVVDAAQWHREFLSSSGSELRQDVPLKQNTALPISNLPPLDLLDVQDEARSTPLIAGFAGAVLAQISQNAQVVRLEPPQRLALAAFYKAQDGKPLFIEESGQRTPLAIALIERLRAAYEDGLNPADYIHASFTSSLSDEHSRVAYELDLASSILRYAHHAAIGRIDPAQISPLITPKLKAPDAGEVLGRVSSSADPVKELESYHPTHRGYHALRAALNELLRGTPPHDAPISISGTPVKLGMSDPRIPQLRVRFALVSHPDTRSDVLDPVLAEALRGFQEAKGMPSHGTLDLGTIKALNAEQDQRTRQIEDIIANMERWRWLPRQLGDFHVWVNIPEYLVRVIQQEMPLYQGRVVVGKKETPTPIFSSSIQYLVVNPTWTPPPSIVKKELLPLYEKDPVAFAKKGLEVIRSKNGAISFRQPPGERNALGRIKFMFPNDHAVYLHDTPSKSFFAQSRRAYSHGCVRVDQPLKFADTLLTHEKGLDSRRLSAMFGSSERYINLRQTIPVHLVYFTSQIDDHGKVSSFDDIYGFHARLKTLLAKQRLMAAKRS